MIQIEHLRKSFGKREILRDLSFDIKPAVITGIAGPNACGKTTLIKCLLGLVLPHHGKISIAGKTVDQSSEGAEARRSIGYMPQNPDFPPNLTVQEILIMVERLRNSKATRKKELTTYFELGSTLSQNFGQLSGGTKQKIAATIAFMFDAPLLILDEPTSGLDPLSTVRFKDLLLREVARGKTILLVSHVMGEMEQLAKDLVYLMDGEIAFQGLISEIKESFGELTLERAITGLMLKKSGHSQSNVEQTP
jgi:Cu-processing system ATP-binding protein